MQRGLDDEAVRAFPWHDAWAGFATFDHQLGRLHVKICLGGRLVVAGDAVHFQEGVNIPVVIQLDGQARG